MIVYVCETAKEGREADGRVVITGEWMSPHHMGKEILGEIINAVI